MFLSYQALWATKLIIGMIFFLQEASSLLASLFLITRRKLENHQDGISMQSLVNPLARNRLASKEKKGQAWKMIRSIFALSLAESETFRKYYCRQLCPNLHFYLNFYILQRDLTDQISKLAPMLLKFVVFLTFIRDDIMLANLLKRIFDKLCINPSFPSMLS